MPRCAKPMSVLPGSPQPDEASLDSANHPGGSDAAPLECSPQLAEMVRRCKLPISMEWSPRPDGGGLYSAQWPKEPRGRYGCFFTASPTNAAAWYLAVASKLLAPSTSPGASSAAGS